MRPRLRSPKSIEGRSEKEISAAVGDLKYNLMRGTVTSTKRVSVLTAEGLTERQADKLVT